MNGRPRSVLSLTVKLDMNLVLVKDDQFHRTSNDIPFWAEYQEPADAERM